MVKKEIRQKGNNDKCDNCGSEVKFNPITQKLNCPSCGAIKNFEKIDKIDTHLTSEKPNSASHKEWLKNNKFLQCDNCGARVVMGRFDMSITCPYCGSDFVSQFDTLPGATPDGIIPFKFDKKTAGRQFASQVKKKFFVPRSFKKNLPTDKIRGVYFPAFLFQADTDSNYSGVLVEDDGDDTHTFKISGNHSQKHKDIVVEASSKISDYDLIKISPYDFSDGCKYNSNFIKGFSVEYYHEIMDHCINIAHNKIKKEVEQSILGKYTYTRVNSLNINTKYTNERYSYYLLPAYNLEYTYKNQKYIAHINGQTGKIGGSLPTSKLKVGILIGIGVVLFGLVVFALLKYI